MNNLYQILNVIVHNQQVLNETLFQLKNSFNLPVLPAPAAAVAQNTKGGNIVNSSHVAIVLGCRKRTAQKKLRSIRIQLGKPVRSNITVNEFAKATQIPVENILPFL